METLKRNILTNVLSYLIIALIGFGVYIMSDVRSLLVNTINETKLNTERSIKNEIRFYNHELESNTWRTRMDVEFEMMKENKSVQK